MKRQGTSEFVRDLVTAWLYEITNPAILDEFEDMIRDRRKKLSIETEDEISDKIVEALSRCKYGDVLHLMNPLKKPTKGKLTVGNLEKYAEEMNRMKCKFYVWQPRKKMLWVTVPWRIKDRPIVLVEDAIRRLQPSRTERSVRILQQQRRA